MDRAARLRRALRTRGVQWPAPLEWHGTLSSTNDVLKAKARLDAPEWTAVLADTQTGGRGREGRVWASPPGGLYLSVVLRPGFAEGGLVPLAAGILAHLSLWYDALESRPSSVVEAWRARAVPWWGEPVRVQTVQGVLRGTLRDVDETGALLVDRGRTACRGCCPDRRCS